MSGGLSKFLGQRFNYSIFSNKLPRELFWGSFCFVLLKEGQMGWLDWWGLRVTSVASAHSSPL